MVGLEHVYAGDYIEINKEVGGEVVFSTATMSYNERFPQAEWPIENYTGIMLRQKNGALVFYPEATFVSGDIRVTLHKSSGGLR